MASYYGSYIASAYRARIDCTVADKSGDSSKSVVTVKVYVEMASGARDGAWNFKARGAVGADSSWSAETTGSSSTYLNGNSYMFNTYTREYSKAASTQSVMCYGQVRNTYTSSWAGPSDARGSVTIPALSTYTVSYDGNAPSGATADVTGLPSSQAKVKGQTLTLATATPSLANYVFTGWNTAADGTGTAYATGGAYSTDAALKLYAQWTPAQIAPTVTLTAFRSDQNGADKPNGTEYIRVSAAWSLDQTGGANTTATTVDFTVAGSSIYTASDQQGTADQQTGAYVGTTAQTVGGTWDGATAYEVTVTVTDSNGLSTTATVTIPQTFPPVSFGYQGRSVGIGALASTSAAELTFGSGLTPVFDNASQWRSQMGANDASNITTGTLPNARVSSVGWTYVMGNASAANYARWCAFGSLVIVEVNIASGTNITSGGVTIGTIGTAAYRPDKATTAPLYHSSNNTGCLWVDTDGAVKASTKASATQTTGYGIVVYKV